MMTTSPTASGAAAATRTPAADGLRAYELSDNLKASSGSVFLTGTQALVRLLLMQRALDAAARA